MSVVEVDSLDQAVEMETRSPVIFLLASLNDDEVGKLAFFEMIMNYFPCDPPFHGRSWDAGMDSIAGGMANLEADNIAVYWKGSSKVRNRNHGLYEQIKESFHLISRELADPKIMFDHVKYVEFYFGP